MLRPAMTVTILGWCLLYCRTKHAYRDASFAGRALDPTDPQHRAEREVAACVPPRCRCCEYAAGVCERHQGHCTTEYSLLHRSEHLDAHKRRPVSSPPSTIVLRYTAVSTTLALHRTKHVYQDTPFAGSTIDPTAEQSMRTETHLSLVECLTLRTPNTGPNGRSQLAYLPDADAVSTLGLLLFIPLRHTQDTQ